MLYAATCLCFLYFMLRYHLSTRNPTTPWEDCLCGDCEHSGNLGHTIYCFCLTCNDHTHVSSGTSDGCFYHQLSPCQCPRHHLLLSIPARLTQHILSGKFVEMHDWLMDNMALHDQLESVQVNVTTTGAPRARLQDVPSLISWVFCFVAYGSFHMKSPTL